LREPGAGVSPRQGAYADLAKRDIVTVTTPIRCGYEIGDDTIRISAGGP